MDLTEDKCVACEGGVDPLSREQVEAYLATLDGWEASDDFTKIGHRFDFRNFAQSLAFVNKVGAIAEAENHHPDILFGWGYCTIVLQTHAIKGLHKNDFIVAAKINALQTT
ncbi:MAG: 4a-hydroxytetrahydrobiopterin dehydratase [Rickettsiales bacterium]|jgi:4a-hydroxytetrahydrobiopterin dehydratase|nr:4a-hydroxytetrahydrobiopterin dehydratase [Rickettsiales bacterium]